MNTCPRCGAYSPRLVDRGGCGVCGHPSSASFVASVYGTPWEHLATRGLRRAIVETVSSVLLAPGRFFARLRTGTDTYKAWLFALTLGSLGAVGAFAWETAFGPTALGSGGHEFDSPAVRLILTPVIITLRLGIVALLCHFMLYATNQRKARLSMSFAAACYAGGAAAVLRVLPLAGETISALVFGLVLIPALAGVHRSRPARVVAGLLLPLLLVAALFAAALAGGATAGLLIHQALKETLAMLR